MWVKTKYYLWLLPAVLTLGILFVGGMFKGSLESLGYYPLIDTTHISFEAYKTILNSQEFWQSLKITFNVILKSTLISGVLGLILAIAIDQVRQRMTFRKTLVLFQLPMTVPHLVAAYAIGLLFMQSGLLSRLLFHLGIIEEIATFPVLVNDLNGWGITLTYIWKETPFVALMLLPVLSRIQLTWKEVASIYGANRFKYFRHVILPLLLPTWASSLFIIFSFMYADFEVPYLLGVTYPKLLSVMAFLYYTSGDYSDRPVALAINMIIGLIAIIFGVIAFKLIKRYILQEENRW